MRSSTPSTVLVVPSANGVGEVGRKRKPDGTEPLSQHRSNISQTEMEALEYKYSFDSLVDESPTKRKTSQSKST